MARPLSRECRDRLEQPREVDVEDEEKRRLKSAANISVDDCTFTSTHQDIHLGNVFAAFHQPYGVARVSSIWDLAQIGTISSSR